MSRWWSSARPFPCAGLAVLLLGGCNGGGGNESGAPSPVAPSVTTLTPAGVAAGTGAFTLTVRGTNFLQSSKVRWNGTAMATTYIGPSQLTVPVTAAQTAQPGEVTVAVVNPQTAGGTSNTVTFLVGAPATVPTISSLVPGEVRAGAAAFTLVVSGNGFFAASTIDWNGVPRLTTYQSPSQLTALVSASDVAVAGTVSITVANPDPGGATSSAAPFTVAPATLSAAYIRQSVAYNAYPGSNSSSWRVELADVLAGSTIYVVGTWPNFSSRYASMGVTDGTNAYALLGRYDDTARFNLGIQGTQSVGHWYASNVPAGSYSINMRPVPGTFEDFVGLIAFEVAGVTASPLDGSALVFQAHVAPGLDTLGAALVSSNPAGILIAMAIDDVDGTVPTVPLVGTGATDAGQFFDFLGDGNASSRAEYALFSSSGSHSVRFSPQERGVQSPDYITVAAFFTASGSGVGVGPSRARLPGAPN